MSAKEACLADPVCYDCHASAVPDEWYSCVSAKQTGYGCSDFGVYLCCYDEQSPVDCAANAQVQSLYECLAKDISGLQCDTWSCGTET